MNYIVISPYYPDNFQRFSIELSKKGINVFGIGEEPYEQLGPELQSALTEYFRVNDLHDQDEVKRAVAFLFYKHGPIDRIESQNEYWLELDAELRTQFNVPGMKNDDMPRFKYKSEMKKYFKKAGVPVVEGAVIANDKDYEKAIKKIGYPVIVKPDNGVGAAATYKITNKKDGEVFLKEWDRDVVYFMEAFVDSPTVLTYDGLIDQHGNIVFETSLVCFDPPLKVVQENFDNVYYIDVKMDKKLRDYGRKIVKEFGITERFFHIEFFTNGNDYIALEYNCRPAGGYTVDAYNYAYSTNLYEQYANIVLDQPFVKSDYKPEYCVTVSRRDEINYEHTHDEILAKYQDQIKLYSRMGAAFANILGNEIYSVNTSKKKEINQIADYITKRA